MHTPLCAYVNLPGCVRANATSSATFFAGTSLLTKSKLGSPYICGSAVADRACHTVDDDRLAECVGEPVCE